MTLSSVPILSIDLVGSILMIIFSFLCMRLVVALRERDPDNVIWTYLLWLCYGLAGFAISRSAGHILKQILLFSGQDSVWSTIRPYSGAINTFMLVFVASVTLFFERIWKLYRQILGDKQALQTAHQQLLYLNQNLENLVVQRTEALTRSEHKYRQIFEVSRDMILVTRQDGAIIDINPAGKSMLGQIDTDQNSTNNHFQSYLPEIKDWHRIREKIETQGFIVSDEIDLKRIDGSRMKALISGSLAKGSSTEEDSFHFLVKDIEQRRLMEQQMAQADKLASIGQLSAGVAHEINNPLGIILGYTQLLLRDEGGPDERKADLKTIEKHVQSCKTIVEDLLNFSRSSKPEIEKIKIHETIDDVMRFIQQHSDLGKTEIIRDYDSEVPPMLLDEKKIKQVLINLIMNAKHAVGKEGMIKLSTHYISSEKKCTIEVKDTGYGIEKKNLSRIFDPFFTTKPTGEGTGLGLSVSYGIIKNHGGDIFVDSIPGVETTFTVVLPVDSKKEEAA